jgi:hypothetical protein
VLPWPAAVAVGMGLLAKLNLFDVIRARVRAGESLHNITSPLVTEAILQGRPAPLYDGDGRELKAQIMPQQLTDWFGIQHARRGQVALLFHPTLRSDIPPTVEPASTGRPAVGDRDFFWPTDELFPDFLELAMASRPERRHTYAEAQEAVGGLPCAAGSLSHDLAANVRVLDRLVSQLTATSR